MNKLTSRITAAVMAAAMAVGFSSCGKSEDVIASKEHVYSSQIIELPKGMTYRQQVIYSNDKLFIIGENSWEDTIPYDDDTTDGSTDEVIDAEEIVVTDVGTDDAAVPAEETFWHSERKMQIVDMEGNLLKEIVLSDESNSDGSRWITNIIVANNGDLIFLEQYNNWDMETGESEETFYISRYSSEDGSKISEASLEKLTANASEDEYIYFRNIVEADDGTFVLPCNSSIFITNDKGDLLGTIKNEAVNDNTWMNGAYKTSDGRIFTVVTTSKMEGEIYTSESKLVEIDVAGRKLGTEYPYTANGSLMNGTDKYDLLLTRDSGLAAYDIETDTTETIVDWLKSGIDTTAMDTSTGISVLPDGRIFLITYDYDWNGGGGYSWSSDDQVVNILTEVDPADIPDKKLIKMYAIYLDTAIKRQILEYNKNSTEYEIELTSYQDYVVNSYDDAVTKLNNDMIAGNLPDILVIDSQLPVDSYISKGLLANLYDFMDKDETFNREDYLQNVFEAYETDGKLYEVVPNFTINTLVGKTSKVGTESGWTMEEFIKFCEENTESVDQVFGDRWGTKASMLQNMIYYNGSNFINKETGECKFNTDEFINLLEFCNKFPKEYEDDSAMDMDPNYWNEYESRFREDRALLSQAYVSSFDFFVQQETGTFGEPITVKGYPTSEGNGSVINADTSMAITSKAKNADGAWDFVKYFYSDDFQDLLSTRNSYTFPVKISSLEKQAESYKEKPYWLNDDGTKEEYDNYYWLGEERIPIPVNTDADNQRMMDFIKSVNNSGRYDQQALTIINEEAGAFFEGQKSAKDVAEIIQNRVSNYIAENR